MSVYAEPQTYGNYIGGEWAASASGRKDASRNPADRQEIVGYSQSSNQEDLNQAAEAAAAAGTAWRRQSGPARGDYLYKAALALESRLDEVAETMTREMGKTLAEARGETARGVAILRYFAGEGMRKTGDVIPRPTRKGLCSLPRTPLGVVGLITPWNFPVAIPIWKIAPALVYGNTVVFKPAEDSPVTAAKVVECFAAAGLPGGVLNMVTGAGSVVGQAIVDHPLIAGISFTGSDATGRRVAQGAVGRGAKYQLETGGKNPVIVCEDADLDLAADAVVSGGLKSTGQKCTCTSRVIVGSGVYEAFKAKLLERIGRIKVGDGLAPDTWRGPCASEGQLDKVLTCIRQGVEEGATLLVGGKRMQGEPYDRGFFLEPTVFEDVEPQMALAQEEIFGPVLALMKAESLEQSLSVANGTRYGLSASIFTRDIGSALAFVREMDAGLVRINAESAGVELQAPFGGMKGSSSGSREQGPAAIEFYTSIKTVFMKG